MSGESRKQRWREKGHLLARPRGEADGQQRVETEEAFKEATRAQEQEPLHITGWQGAYGSHESGLLAGFDGWLISMQLGL
jgi:hypothetical protein